MSNYDLESAIVAILSDPSIEDADDMADAIIAASEEFDVPRIDIENRLDALLFNTEIVESVNEDLETLITEKNLALATVEVLVNGYK